MEAFEIFEETAELLTVDAVICFAGLIVFGVWLVRSGWGTKALADLQPRRNCMPVYLPFAALFLWFSAVAGALAVTQELPAKLADWQRVLLQNVVICAVSVLMAAVIILLARVTFVRGLKGLGLNARTTGKDLGAAFLNLVAIWPMVILAFLLTLMIGGLIYGPQFEMQRHEELKLLAEHRQAIVKVVIAITTIAIVPAGEELLFRGLFQTMIRSYIASAWGAILLTSVLFAIVHANAGHWAALFVLSLSMGYAYEKRGSLLRPIFIHLLFNASSVIATLYQ